MALYDGSAALGAVATSDGVLLLFGLLHSAPKVTNALPESTTCTRELACSKQDQDEHRNQYEVPRLE